MKMWLALGPSLTQRAHCPHLSSWFIPALCTEALREPCLPWYPHPGYPAVAASPVCSPSRGSSPAWLSPSPHCPPGFQLLMSVTSSTCGLMGGVNSELMRPCAWQHPVFKQQRAQSVSSAPSWLCPARGPLPNRCSHCGEHEHVSCSRPEALPIASLLVTGRAWLAPVWAPTPRAQHVEPGLQDGPQPMSQVPEGHWDGHRVGRGTLKDHQMGCRTPCWYHPGSAHSLLALGTRSGMWRVEWGALGPLLRLGCFQRLCAFV